MNSSYIDERAAAPSFHPDDKLLQATIASVKDGIIVVAQNGQILFWNQQFVDMWEIPPEIITERNDEALLKFVATKIKNADSFLTKVLQLYDSPDKDFDTIIFKDGKVFERFSAPLIYAETIKGRIWSFKDVTDKKRLESQLIQAQKMEAIGTLATGVAHDFNNVLTLIKKCTANLLADDNCPEQRNSALKEIQTHVQAASDLIQQLFGFSGEGVLTKVPVDVKKLVKKSMDTFCRDKQNLVLKKSFSDDLWRIEADPVQMEQVLFNLLDNAWLSMPRGGEISVCVENAIINASDQKELHLPQGRYVTICLHDSGMGMNQATQKRIFEPFFTTNKMGRGSGFGLATVYGIIKSHGGDIFVKSALGKGTDFMVYLPVQETGPKDESGEKPAFMNGTETILIIDDEDMVIDVGTAMLSKMGYHVLTAESGRAAIEIYENESQNIDLVILDMVMPQMDGKEIHDRLKKINPDVRVILSSGYSFNDQASEIMDCGCIDFIQKPFNMSQLSKIVSNALQQ